MKEFVTGYLTGIPLMIAVGPIAIMLIQLGVRRGFAAAWPAAAGVGAADLTYATVAAAGGAGLQQALRPIAPMLPDVAAAVLIAMAASMVFNATRVLRAETCRDGSARPHTLPPAPSSGSGWDAGLGGRRLALSMFGLTVVNPMTVLAFTSVAVASGPRAAMPGWPIGIWAASVSVHLGLVGLGARVRHGLPARGASWLQIAGAVAIVGMAANLAAGS